MFNAAKLIGLETVVYNAVMSDEKLHIPEENITKTITQKDMAEQFNAIFEEMEFAIYIMVGFGFTMMIKAE